MRFKSLLATLLVAVLVFVDPTLAAAPKTETKNSPPPAVAVTPSGCIGLDVAETERLLRIELAIVAARTERVRAPVVHITCSESVITIRVFDAVAQRTIEETMPAPPALQPGRERVIALAASQLFLSSWLEVLLEHSPAAEPAPKPAKTRAAPRLELQNQKRAPALQWYAAALAELRLHHLSSPITGLLPRLEFGARSQLLRVALHATGEWAHASRAEGDVSLWLLGGGASIGHETGQSSLHWLLGARTTAYYVRAQPSARGGAQARTAAGSAFDVALAGGPALVLDRSWTVCLELALGVLLPRVVARVDRDEDVRLDGWFVSVGFGVRYAIGNAP